VLHEEGSYSARGIALGKTRCFATNAFVAGCRILFSFMITWYVAIKLGEWVIWSGIGIFFLVKTWCGQERPLWLYLALAAAFLVFGFADFIEYFTNGTFPWWLWVWKIGGGLTLFALLVTRDYVKRGRAALAPWRFVAAAVILTLAVICVMKS
jgi:hypothetical protein